MIRLNKILRLLNISLKDAIKVLEKRTDLGNFKPTMSFKLNQNQIDTLTNHVKKTENTKNKSLNAYNDNNSSKQHSNNQIKITDKISTRANIFTINIKNDDNQKIVNTINSKCTNINILNQNPPKEKIKLIRTKGKIFVLEINVSCLTFKKNRIIFDYKGTPLYIYANGISAILNKYIDEISNVFPHITIKANLPDQTFDFMNPKFYLYITKLCTDKKEIGYIKQKEKSQNTITKNQTINYNKTQLLTINNIEFFDNYYKIWILNDKKIKYNKITPYTIKDKNSHACFNLLSKYFSNRIPDNITILYSTDSIIYIEDKFKLDVYIKILKANLISHGEWEYELKNFHKQSLRSCINKSEKTIHKYIAYKSIYIDYLASIQNDRQLIKAYEIFNGFEEDCFIFTITMYENLYAIIYENVSFARATELFIVHKKDYDKSINLIFNYFTNYELKNKRLAIKRKYILPYKFKSLRYYTINHNNLSIWINKINTILKENNTKKQNIQFKPGLKVIKEIDSRIFTKDNTDVCHIHNDLMKKLYTKLVKEVGKNNIGTEIIIGNKRIDLVVKNNNSYDIYEIKSNPNVRICIRQAIGQILDYAYFECLNKIEKMTIIGPSPITEEANDYLMKIRELHSINIYYDTV